MNHTTNDTTKTKRLPLLYSVTSESLTVHLRAPSLPRKDRSCPRTVRLPTGAAKLGLSQPKRKDDKETVFWTFPMEDRLAGVALCGARDLRSMHFLHPHNLSGNQGLDRVGQGQHPSREAGVLGTLM
ncbi:unnamed protein product [Boreogadus saida]